MTLADELDSFDINKSCYVLVLVEHSFFSSDILMLIVQKHTCSNIRNHVKISTFKIEKIFELKGENLILE